MMAVKRIIMVSVNLIGNITGMFCGKIIVSPAFCTWLGGGLGGSVRQSVSVIWRLAVFLFWFGGFCVCVKVSKTGENGNCSLTDSVRWTLPTVNWTKFHLLVACSPLDIWEWWLSGWFYIDQIGTGNLEARSLDTFSYRHLIFCSFQQFSSNKILFFSGWSYMNKCASYHRKHYMV